MNEFLEQFLIESREYVEHTSTDLLALEKTPDDKVRLDSAFRAFHTLKGGAGIVDFAPMAEAVHAAEDVLSHARSGTRRITTPLVSDCLACLDQVARWLDTIESTGDLPQNAEGAAAAIVARFARSTGDSTDTVPAEPRAGDENWIAKLLAKDATLRGRAATAIRYIPGRDCFYEGVDPLARIAGLSGLLAIDAGPALPWPPLDALDPFVCNLVLTALTRSSRAEVNAALGAAADQCEVRSLAGHGRANEEHAISQHAREILEAQILLIGETGTQGARGRIAAAGAVVANVLRHAGLVAAAGDVARAVEVSLRENEPRLLREAIEFALTEKSPTAALAPAIEQEGKARTLRVDAGRIDALVNLTGELTVAKNSIGHAAKLAQDGDNVLAPILKHRYAVLDRLVGELQRSVLGMRVLPLRHVFQRFPRLVREIAGNLGKPASLLIEGGETEADKAIVEMLFEPLLHVLRNAIDHGIENAVARAAHGKPAVATIRLRADRRGEHVIVEVSDDGNGIDVARVRQVALERNLATEEDIAAMNGESVIDMIFEPGFSTASEVTGLSGRGVGMDAVRTAVERLAGKVNVESRAGKGTTVRFTLPFSVMMTRVMAVDAGGQTFGIPLDAVVETLRVEVGRIAPIGAAHAIVLRNRTIPLVTLAQTLGLSHDERIEAEATIVVTNIDGHHGALSVDRIGERMDVMLKPLDGLLAGMHGIAGSTLLGDGSVLLVLDLAELFQ